MLTEVQIGRLQTGSGSAEPGLILPLASFTSGYLIDGIDGLDPVKASISSTNTYGVPGERKQGSKREKRNIILNITYKPEYTSLTVEQLRKKLYWYLMPETEVVLRFTSSDGLVVTIVGTVESFEAPLFSKEPSVAISILCHNPDFYDVNLTTVSGMTSVSGLPALIIDYPGTLTTGFILTANIPRTVSKFTVRNEIGLRSSPYWEAEYFDFFSSDSLTHLANGDIFTINSIVGQKSMTRKRGNATTSAMASLTAVSNWPSLHPGTNRLLFVVSGTPGFPVELKYRAVYGGL